MPFSSKIKEKFLGKDGEKFQNASLEVFKVTKTSYLGRIVPMITYIIAISFIYYVISHPISLIFPQYIDIMPQLQEVANTVEGAGIQEFGIINALRINPGAFSGISADLTPIVQFNTSWLGIDIMLPVNLKSFGVILPILITAYFLYVIAKMVIPVIKKKVELSKIGFKLALFIFCAFLSIGSTFTSSIIIHIYFLIVLGFGLFTNPFFNKLLTKKMKPWIIETNGKCQEILKKYGIEDEVTAVHVNKKADTEHTVSDNG